MMNLVSLAGEAETMILFKLALLVVFCCLYCDGGIISTNETLRVNTETRSLVKEEPKKKQENNFMTRILPMLVTPFIMQVTLLPLVLMGMKFMLLNSMFLGKLGVLLWIFHLIKNRDNYGGGLFSHNVNMNHNSHEGHENYQKNYRYSDHYNY